MSDLHNSLPSALMEMVSHCRQLDRLAGKVFDLWTWLPLRRKMERFHGDYVDEVQPPTEVVVESANDMISFLMGFDNLNFCNDIDFDEEYMICYCGETHEAGTDDHSDYSNGDKVEAERLRAKVIAIHQFAKQWDEEHP